MDRLQQKFEMCTKLGMLFGPLLRLADHPDRYDEQERAEVLARYFGEYDGLGTEFRQFCTGQPGHNYAIQHLRFHMALSAVLNRLLNRPDSLVTIVREEFANARSAIDEVPVPATSVILEAGSPFTAYNRLRELCEADATKSLVWLDPYMGPSMFGRYLVNVRPNVPVTLVTAEPGPRAGTNNSQRWNDFLDISRLFAQERGPAEYRLVVFPDLHDRWVVFDSKRIYSLGGSVKDAANRDYFTIASVEGSDANLKKVQYHVDNGVEYFGPTVSVHR